MPTDTDKTLKVLTKTDVFKSLGKRLIILGEGKKTIHIIQLLPDGFKFKIKQKDGQYTENNFWVAYPPYKKGKEVSFYED